MKEGRLTKKEAVQNTIIRWVNVPLGGVQAGNPARACASAREIMGGRWRESGFSLSVREFQRSNKLTARVSQVETSIGLMFSFMKT